MSAEAQSILNQVLQAIVPVIAVVVLKSVIAPLLDALTKRWHLQTNEQFRRTLEELVEVAVTAAKQAGLIAKFEHGATGLMDDALHRAQELLAAHGLPEVDLAALASLVRQALELAIATDPPETKRGLVLSVNPYSGWGLVDEEK